jgi:uncharacterized membrane protein YphA (DoxX/SURF4 family)
MSFAHKLDKIHLKARENRWLRYFSIFCRILLAYAFVMAGMVKILDERFASGLSVLHPMGSYLEALHHTGFYYTFIGVAQIVAAVLLLIPRTVVLGAVIYFPIILNICILSLAVRFEGSFVTSPLMVLANLFILLWYYDRLKYMLPFKTFSERRILKKPEKYSNKFPFLFFTGVAITFGIVIAIAFYGHEVMPRNSLSDCKKQFVNTEKETAGFNFCECIHSSGKPLNYCLEIFEKERNN